MGIQNASHVRIVDISSRDCCCDIIPVSGSRFAVAVWLHRYTVDLWDELNCAVEDWPASPCLLMSPHWSVQGWEELIQPLPIGGCCKAMGPYLKLTAVNVKPSPTSVVIGHAPSHVPSDAELEWLYW